MIVVGDDEMLLFSEHEYGRERPKRQRKKVESIAPVPWRDGWYRVRQSKGPIPFWHLIAPGDGNHGSFSTLCGRKGSPVSHSVTYDGPNMIECDECAAAPPVSGGTFHPPTSRTRHPSNTSRRTDPDTSVAAARSQPMVTTELQLSAIDRALREAEDRGLTDEELCDALLGTGWADSGIRTRRATLVDMAVIAWRGDTRPSRRGREMRVWVHADWSSK